ncbi:DUF4573 domain-containing protein [Nonomuraea sp. NPDC049750]|uniref:DUF4573 domain-containing protein n=1 Tax=Nonomuraea sp. NPDC049750 TaxID=3154738 RepID=UPI0033C4EE7E
MIPCSRQRLARRGMGKATPCSASGCQCHLRRPPGHPSQRPCMRWSSPYLGRAVGYHPLQRTVEYHPLQRTVECHPLERTVECHPLQRTVECHPLERTVECHPLEREGERPPRGARSWIAGRVLVQGPRAGAGPPATVGGSGARDGRKAGSL